MLVILLTGCTETIKEGKEVVTNQETGQTLTANILCKPEEQHKCDNRALLKSLMEQSGLRSIKNEWWHYQKKGDTSIYPLIRVCDIEGSVCYGKDVK